MPLYEYQCTACGEKLEIRATINQEAPGCPVCGGTTERAVSSSSFRLNGSGWAKDNYAGK